MFYGVLTAPPDEPESYRALGTAAIAFVADYDGAVSRRYGAAGTPRTIVLDPMLRAVADIPWDYPDGHAPTVREVLASLPAVDDSAGVPLTAPVLIVPRVFDFALCEFLIGFYEKFGGKDSGFLLDSDGKTSTVVDYRLKRRNDLPVAAPAIARRDPRSDRAPPAAGRRALLPVPGDAHGPLHRRLLRQRGRRPFLSPSRQCQRGR